MVCYIDKYGNLITNITKQIFKKLEKTNHSKFFLQNQNIVLKKFIINIMTLLREKELPYLEVVVF